MDMEVRLDFLRQLLKNMNVSSCVITCPGQRIPPEIDLNFRANLFGIQNYSDFLQNSMSQARDQTLYRFYDEYDCNYIFLRLRPLFADAAAGAAGLPEGCNARSFSGAKGLYAAVLHFAASDR